MALLADSWNDLEACPPVCPPTAVPLVCRPAVRRPRPWQSFHPVSVHNLCPSISPPTNPLLSLIPISSTWKVSFRMTVALTWRLTPGSAKLPKPLAASVASLGARRSALKPSFAFSFVIIPTLLYGMECVVLLQPHVHQLQIFFMHCLHIILGICLGYEAQHHHPQTGSSLYFCCVASSFLVTSPGCLIHGFPSNCWYAPLLKGPSQYVVRSVAGTTWFSGTW